MADKSNTGRGPEPLSLILERVIKKTLSRTGPPVQRIWDVWNDAVGPDVAGNAQPKVYKKGILIVAVSSGPWAQELQFYASEIRDRINRAVGAVLVDEIRFKVGR